MSSGLKLPLCLDAFPKGVRANWSVFKSNFSAIAMLISYNKQFVSLSFPYGLSSQMRAQATSYFEIKGGAPTLVPYTIRLHALATRLALSASTLNLRQNAVHTL